MAKVEVKDEDDKDKNDKNGRRQEGGYLRSASESF